MKNGSELVVNEEKLRNRGDIKREIKRFWEEIGRGRGFLNGNWKWKRL